MSVKMCVHPFIAEDGIPTDAITVEGKTVGACIAHALKRFPTLKNKLFSSPGALHSYLEVYVNDKSVYPDELTSLVRENDEISITYLLAGG